MTRRLMHSAMPNRIRLVDGGDSGRGRFGFLASGGQQEPAPPPSRHDPDEPPPIGEPPPPIPVPPAPETPPMQLSATPA